MSDQPTTMPSMPGMPNIPAGENPETYMIDEVSRLLKSAAYFPIFSVANPASPNKPLPLNSLTPFLLKGVEVNEQLHRFDIRVSGLSNGAGLRASNTIGEPVARVQIRWMPMPDDFEAGPGREPPTTILNPFTSQRFCMLDGHLEFEDGHGTGFKAFGAGRTFPVKEGGETRLRIGAVIDILEGLGNFAGLGGTVVVNGFIQPPEGLALQLMVRLMDPEGKLPTTTDLAPVKPLPHPDPNAVFVTVMGEVDPDQPVELNLGPDGRILGSNVHELLRLVHVGFDIDHDAGLRAAITEGPIIGSVAARLHFNPFNPLPISPIQTTRGVFTFFDQDRHVVGTVNSNMTEGRALRTELQGAPMPVFRFGGFGMITGGTGQFDGVSGLMTMNSIISVFPRTLSNLYILRFFDPEGKIRETITNAGTT